MQTTQEFVIRKNDGLTGRLLKYKRVNASLAGLFCIILGQTNLQAMPTPRYHQQTQSLTKYEADLDEWAAIINDPVYQSSYDSIFSARDLTPTTAGSESWTEIPVDHALSHRDRAEMRSLYESLKNVAEGRSELPPLLGSSQRNNLQNETPHIGDLLGEIRKNTESLIADSARIHDPLTLSPTNDNVGYDARQVSYSTEDITLRPRATEVQSLVTPLGPIGNETLRPILQTGGIIADSLADLRQFVLIEQPKSSTLMMMDSGSGQALVMQNSGAGNFATTANRTSHTPRQEQATSHQRATSNSAIDFLKRPLKEVFWEILKSDMAMVFAGLCFLAWIAWRKVISRHV